MKSQGRLAYKSQVVKVPALLVPRPSITEGAQSQDKCPALPVILSLSAKWQTRQSGGNCGCPVIDRKTQEWGSYPYRTIAT